jgi:8-oxo-dGTP pyrophosphatase MutT (NUDIX family)
MAAPDPDHVFRQTGWPGLRARLFHLYFVLRRPMTLGVRGLIHDTASNSVFLIRHTYVPGWQFPGGGVETGETLAEALARELAEEGNIALTVPPVLKSMHFNRRASRRDHVGFYLIEQLARPRLSCRTTRSPKRDSSRSMACPRRRRRQHCGGSPRFSGERPSRHIGRLALPI